MPSMIDSLLPPGPGRRRSPYAEQAVVYKGFHVFEDQYDRLLRLAAERGASGRASASTSELLRCAIDDYLNVLRCQQSLPSDAKANGSDAGTEPPSWTCV